MARRGPQYDLLQLLLRGGDQRLDEASEERLEQLARKSLRRCDTARVPSAQIPRRFLFSTI